MSSSPTKRFALDSLPLAGLEEELYAVGGAWCWSEISACLSSLQGNKFEPSVLESRLLVLRELSWEKLHTGYWKDVPISWRDLYAMSIVLAVVSGVEKEPLKMLDMALLMGGPRFAEVLHQLISKSNSLGAQEVVSSPSKKRKSDEISVASPVTTPSFPVAMMELKGPLIERVHCPSLTKYMTSAKPVIITGFMNAWPARSNPDRCWSNLNNLKRIAGGRTVPIELGSSYTHEDYEQTLMALSEFIDTHVLEEGSKRGYLAQTQLFEQIPDLKKDIIVPDYCSLGEFDEPIINAWFGPSGTVCIPRTTLANSPAQVVGEKFIRLFNPSQTEYLYPHEDKLLWNTSQVDIESPDLEKFPLFRQALYTECILKAGEMLYIPPTFWHHVRSLSVSFSVSFWWE